MPNYNVMGGREKQHLRPRCAINLAVSISEEGKIRVNSISAGPVRTLGGRRDRRLPAPCSLSSRSIRRSGAGVTPRRKPRRLGALSAVLILSTGVTGGNPLCRFRLQHYFDASAGGSESPRPSSLIPPRDDARRAWKAGRARAAVDCSGRMNGPPTATILNSRTAKIQPRADHDIRRPRMSRRGFPRSLGQRSVEHIEHPVARCPQPGRHRIHLESLGRDLQPSAGLDATRHEEQPVKIFSRAADSPKGRREFSLPDSAQWT